MARLATRRRVSRNGHRGLPDPSRDGRAADSLALLGRTAAALDSLALERSAYVGRAELVRARARKALGDVAAARGAGDHAVVALANGYGPDNRHTRDARVLRKSLDD